MPENRLFVQYHIWQTSNAGADLIETFIFIIKTRSCVCYRHIGRMTEDLINHQSETFMKDCTHHQGIFQKTGLVGCDGKQSFALHCKKTQRQER